MEVGLVGILSPDPAAHTHIDGMARQLVSIENSAQTRLDARHITLRTRIAPWIQPPDAHDPDSGTRLILLGHSWRDNREVHADALLKDFLRDGETALTVSGGSFAVLVWQPRTETLHIVTDRLGTKKIYLWHSVETILLATELHALLAHPQAPREIDESAVEQFLITSHLVGTHSLIRNVQVLPPGTITRINQSGVSSRYYWEPCIVPARDDGLNAWADRLAGILSSAIRSRCGDSNILLPISGGLDSRCVAAFIPATQISSVAMCSFGHRHCYDVRYGRRVAHAMGAKFSYLPLPEDFFRQYLNPVLALCDGEVSIEALPMYRLIESGNPGQHMLLGYLGDALSGGHLLTTRGMHETSITDDNIWLRKYQGKGFSEQQLQSILLPERHHAMIGGTRRLMKAALVGAAAETPDEKALVVELHHRQSRYISYFSRILSSRYRVENPFLDTAVLDAFLAMPLIHRQGQRAYRRMLVRHAPRLAAVPEMKTHRPVTYADIHGIHPANHSTESSRTPTGLQWRLNKTRRMLDNLLNTLSGGWLGPHARDYYAHHDESIRRVDTEWFRESLLGNPLAQDWFNPKGLEALFDEHMSRKQDHSTRINNVVAFLAWRKATGV